MITFPENIVLEDDRVLLRPLELADLDHLLPFATSEPEIWDYFTIRAGGTEGMSTFIADTIKQRDKKKEYPFIVYDKTAAGYAGSTRFYDIQLRNATAQLGYTWYGKAFRRTGLNRHCKLLMLTYAFESWGLERVEFRADARNERSINAMKAIGCTVEGVLRSVATLDSGLRRDSIVLSILKSEWLNGVKENLQKKIHS